MSLKMNPYFSRFLHHQSAFTMAVDPLKEKALADYKKKLMEHREVLEEWSRKFVNKVA